ncbi:MAG: hypothetical protein IT381_23700 [Deltaproteobacteria bacterium]|nr:hypothetical protein [Deltaproteobacteria bacterium]
MDALQRTRRSVDATGFRSDELAPFLRVRIDRESRRQNAFANFEEAIILLELAEADGDAVAHELGHLLSLGKLNPWLALRPESVAWREAMADVIAAFTYRGSIVAETIVSRDLSVFRGTSILDSEGHNAGLFYGNALWELRCALGDSAWPTVLQMMLLAHVLMPSDRPVTPVGFFRALEESARVMEAAGLAAFAARALPWIEKLATERGVDPATFSSRELAARSIALRKPPSFGVAAELSHFLNLHRRGHFVAESTLTLPLGMRLLTVRERSRQAVAIVDRAGVPLRMWYRQRGE